MLNMDRQPFCFSLPQSGKHFYGHKLLPGERFSPKMTERQADALLRSDLRKLCAMFRDFSRDSLLLATLAYNVGCGKVMKSRMYAKMRSGN